MRAVLLALTLLLPLTLLPTAAGGQVVPDPLPAFGDLDSPLRPGADMPGCTFNFVFYDGVLDRLPDGTFEDPTAYIGTAAHCTDEVGEVVDLVGYGPIGTVVFDSDIDIAPNNNADFALIELFPHVIGDTNPTVLDWGGPVGFITPDELQIGDVFSIHGYGMGFGELEQTQARKAVLAGWDADEYSSFGPIYFGDSGASLVHDRTGKALGIVSRAGLDAPFPPSSLTGAMLPYIFEELAEAGFGDVVLADGQPFANPVIDF